MSVTGMQVNTSASLPVDAKQTVEIPKVLVEKIEELIKNFNTGTNNKKETAIKLFSTAGMEVGTPEKPSPLVQQWLIATGYFATKSHWKPNIRDASFEWEIAKDHFFEIEHSLYALSTEFFTAIGGLDDILVSANA